MGVGRRTLACRAAIGLPGVLLAACAPGRPGSAEQPGATLPPARVEGWTHLGGQADKDTLKTLGEAFTQAHPGVSAAWVHVPPGSWVGLMEKLTPALVGGRRRT